MKTGKNSFKTVSRNRTKSSIFNFLECRRYDTPKQWWENKMGFLHKQPINKLKTSTYITNIMVERSYNMGKGNVWRKYFPSARYLYVYSTIHNTMKKCIFPPLLVKDNDKCSNSLSTKEFKTSINAVVQCILHYLFNENPSKYDDQATVRRAYFQLVSKRQ